MSRSIWPAIRTVGIAIAVAMLPAIYTQNHQEAKEHQDQFYTLISEISDLKVLALSRFAEIDQEYKELNYRVSNLEKETPVYRK